MIKGEIMFVRKDSIRTIDDYIKDCENMKRQGLPEDTLNGLIRYAENLKKQPCEYIWVDRG